MKEQNKTIKASIDSKPVGTIYNSYIYYIKYTVCALYYISVNNYFSTCNYQLVITIYLTTYPTIPYTFLLYLRITISMIISTLKYI